MARKGNNSRRDDTPVSTPSRSSGVASSTSKAAPGRSSPSAAGYYRASAERLASEQAQRSIEAARQSQSRADDLRHGVLSRTPAALAKPAAQALADAERKQALADAERKQARSKELKRALKNKSRLGKAGALTSKPERGALRSVDKLRDLKCKARPKPKQRPRGKGGGGKRFIPWC